MQPDPSDSPASAQAYAAPGEAHAFPALPSAKPGDEVPPNPRGYSAGPAFDLEAAIDRYQSPLLRYVTQLLGNQAATDEAEDIVQESFIRLHRQVTQHGQHSIKDLFVWLGRVAHNLAIDTGRRRTRHKNNKQQMNLHAQANPTPSQSASPDPLSGLADREACKLAMAELQNLPDNQRQAIQLRIFEGLTMQQIAELTDTTASNVCYRLSQGMATLSRAMKRQGVI